MQQVAVQLDKYALGGSSVVSTLSAQLHPDPNITVDPENALHAAVNSSFAFWVSRKHCPKSASLT